MQKLALILFAMCTCKFERQDLEDEGLSLTTLLSNATAAKGVGLQDLNQEMWLTSKVAHSRYGATFVCLNIGRTRQRARITTTRIRGNSW
jgi:hypothetical protein